MKVYLGRIGPYPLADTMRELARRSTRHELVDAPEDADLVLLCGSFAYTPQYLLDHPVYRAHGRACAVYSCDDAYLPLAPGVYASPRRGPSTAVGRVRSHAYASSFVNHANPAVAEASARWPDLPCEKRYLFSFVGSPNSTLRRRLLRRLSGQADALVADSRPFYKHFDHEAPGRDAGQSGYVDTVLASQFVLCPRGWGTGSLRLFEVMSLGVAPVLLADAYVLPRGPDWDTFLLRVPERRLLELPGLLRREASTAARRGELARAAWEAWFSEDVLFDGIVDAAHEARTSGGWAEGVYRRLPRLFVAWFRLRLWGTQAATRARARVMARVRQPSAGTR